MTVCYRSSAILLGIFVCGFSNGAELSSNGDTSADAICKPVNDGDDSLSVCHHMATGDVESCSVWIQEMTANGGDGAKETNERSCQKCTVCEDGDGFSFDCSNVAEDFKVDACVGDIIVPEDLTMISSVDTEEEETENDDSETSDATPSNEDDYTRPFKNTAMMMTFYGMEEFNHHAQRVFPTEYKKFVQSYYEARGAEAIVSINLTGVDTSPFDRRRRLGQGPAVAVVFDQESKYRGLPPSTTPEVFVSEPFGDCDGELLIDDADCDGTKLFLQQLSSSHETFAGVTKIVGPVGAELNEESTTTETQGDTASPASSGIGSNTVIIVIVIVVTVIVEVLLMGVAYYLWKKRKQNKEEGTLEGKEVKTAGTEDEEDGKSSKNEEEKGQNEEHLEDDNMSLGPSIVDNYLVDEDDGTVSYLDPGSHRHFASHAPSLVSDADDQTAEYDYRKAFLGGPYNGQSVVSGDGTQYTRDDGTQYTRDDGTQYTRDDGTQYTRDDGTQYTEDDHTRAIMPYLLPYKGMPKGKSWKHAAAYYQNGQRTTINAPPGKLGLVIDNPDGWAPVIHTVSPASVLRDRLRVGDRLLAVDDIDVTGKTAVQVSKLIAKRCDRVRVFKIVRAPAYEEV